MNNVKVNEKDVFTLLQEFAKSTTIDKYDTSDKIEIYNEASVQFELAIFLREKLGRQYKIQLEKNIKDDDFKKNKKIDSPQKKEIDIVFSKKSGEYHCIELKFPTQGQYPEQMFSSCKDVKFLEQLVKSGFKSSYFMMFVKDPIFYETKTKKSGIYEKFREEKEISGIIEKPTGKKEKKSLEFNETYKINWVEIKNPLKYFIIKVK